MVNWNSVRKSFVLLALVALLVACSRSAVETTPTADAHSTLAASPTATQPTATAVAPTSPATTTPATRPAILDVFPLSVGATWVYSVTVDDVVEYHWTGLVTETITAGLGWIFQSDVQGHPIRTQPVDRSQSYVVQDERVYKVPGDRNPTEYVATEGQSFGVSQILVWPLSIGQKWGPDESLPRGDGMYVWRVEAQENVSTPAGGFDGCYGLAFDWTDSNQLAWFCAGVGFVRLETHHHGRCHDEVWELREFQPGEVTRAAAPASIQVEEYPIVASGVYTPDRLEYTQLISSTILARRSEWRGYRTAERTAGVNEVLTRFGYRLAPMRGSLYDLYQGNKLIHSEVKEIGWVMVNRRGDDFALSLTDRKGREFVLRPAGLEPWSQYAYTRPILVGSDLVTVGKPADTFPDTVMVRRGNQAVYTAPVSDRRTDYPVKGVRAWNEHWVLEVQGRW